MKCTPDMMDAVTACAPGARIVGVHPLVGGVSALVVRLDLEEAGRAHSVVFRQHSDRVQKNHRQTVAAKEFVVLAHLSRAGLPVPAPLAVCKTQTADGPWLVLQWMEGSTELAPAAVDAGLDLMVDFLHQLQAVALPTEPPFGLEPIEDPAEALDPYLPDDPTGHRIRSKLAAGLARSPNAPVWVHGDYWPGNVLFHNGQLVAVIDWEDAAIGDPLVDLATARIELLCAYGLPAVERFTARFLERQPLDLTDLPLWEVYVSAAALSSMHQWGLPPHEEAARREATRAFFDRAAEELLGG